MLITECLSLTGQAGILGLEGQARAGDLEPSLAPPLKAPCWYGLSGVGLSLPTTLAALLHEMGVRSRGEREGAKELFKLYLSLSWRVEGEPHDLGSSC